MARSISSTLLTAQQAASRTPYIKMLFTSKDGLTTKDFSTDSSAFGNRILAIDHQEEAYNEYALVLLRDYDSTIPDITGYWTSIGYGLTTGAGNEYSGTQTPRLWVKHQRHVSAGGKLLTVLELEGQWAKLRDGLLRMGTAPYYTQSYDGSTDSVYDVLLALLIEVFGGTNPLSATPPDDGIIDTLLPVFTVNNPPFEYAAGSVYRLIKLTKCFLRNRFNASYPENTFQVVYPQAADAADETYYSNPTLGSTSGFYSFMERNPALVPNDILVFANRSADGTWASIVTGEAVSQADIDKYDTAYHIAIAPDVTTEAMADKLAQAILARVRAEQDTGLAVVPHDGRVELYDKAAFVDNRGGAVTYPSNSLTRVGGLHHIYQPGKYLLEIYLGGVSNTAMDEYTADINIMGKDIAGQSKEAVRTHALWREPSERHPVGIAPVEPSAVSPSEREVMDRLIAGAGTPTAPIVIPSGKVTAPTPTSVPGPSLWQTITPWKEERGETFASAIASMWRAITPWKEEKGETLTTVLRTQYEKSRLRDIVEAIKAPYEKSTLRKWIGGLFR